MNEIKLNYLKLKTFSLQDALDYCQINNINSDNITELDLSFNELTDISGVKIFKNLKILYLNSNNISNISVLKDLKILKQLYLGYTKITDISVLKNLTELEILSLSNNKIKNISILKNLNNLEILNINDLKLRSNQIEHINSCKNLKQLWCMKGFKKMNILNQLNNKNIEIYKSL